MIFEVQDGCFSYDPDRILLDHIQLKVDPAQILTVLGANGIGKTTLLKCMMGLLRWTHGQSLIDHENICAIPPNRLWRRIGYVPQARTSGFAYTAEEMVLLGRSAHLGLMKQPTKEDHRIALESLETLGISHLRSKLLSKVSGGELQMVLIARALAAQPELMILDEPESNLDFRNQLIILDTIKRLRRERGLSFIVNTHSPEHALSVSDQTILLMEDGKSICGPAQEIITENNLARAFSVDVRMRTFSIGQDEHTCILPIRPK